MRYLILATALIATPAAAGEVEGRGCLDPEPLIVMTDLMLEGREDDANDYMRVQEAVGNCGLFRGTVARHIAIEPRRVFPGRTAVLAAIEFVGGVRIFAFVPPEYLDEPEV